MELLVFGNQLGKGSFGYVYTIKLENGTLAAIKVISSEQYGLSSVSEIDIMFRLNHPNLMHGLGLKNLNIEIPVMFDRFVYEKSLGIIMPLAISNLMDYVITYHQVTSEKTKLFFDIAAGLQFLHSQYILHADIKPENILIFPDNKTKTVRAVIGDFGQAIYADCTDSRYYNRELTTITYRAPELFMGRTYSRKTDVWAFGITILFCLWGNKRPILNIPAHDASNRNLVKNEIDIYFNDKVRRNNLTRFLSEIDHAYQVYYVDLLYHMLDPNPNTRWNIDQVLNSPLFSRYRGLLPSGTTRNPPIHRSNNCNLAAYYGFDLLIRANLYFSSLTETAFLSADIYQRSIPLIPLTGDFIGDRDKVSLYALVAFSIGFKTIEDRILSPEYLLQFASRNLPNNTLSKELLILAELALVENFGGIIYRRNLYHTSQCKTKLLTAFEYLRNCFIYPRLDFEAWCQSPCPLPGNGMNTNRSKTKKYLTMQVVLPGNKGTRINITQEQRCPKCELSQILFPAFYNKTFYFQNTIFPDYINILYNLDVK